MARASEKGPVRYMPVCTSSISSRYPFSSRRSLQMANDLLRHAADAADPLDQLGLDDGHIVFCQHGVDAGQGVGSEWIDVEHVAIERIDVLLVGCIPGAGEREQRLAAEARFESEHMPPGKLGHQSDLQGVFHSGGAADGRQHPFEARQFAQPGGNQGFGIGVGQGCHLRHIGARIVAANAAGHAADPIQDCPAVGIDKMAGGPHIGRVESGGGDGLCKRGTVEPAEERLAQIHIAFDLGKFRRNAFVHLGVGLLEACMKCRLEMVLG